MTIGNFSRATHLSVKMLRHYHGIGLLEPAAFDPDTGYRRYCTTQIAAAQAIRRFRDLDMPLEEIHRVLAAPGTRPPGIRAHLARLEAGLARTWDAVATLRGLIDGPPAPVPIRRCHVDAVPAAAVTPTADSADALTWYQGALGELHATLAAQRIPVAGPRRRDLPGRALHRGTRPGHDLRTLPGPPRPMGGVAAVTVPEADLPPPSTTARTRASTWPTAGSPAI